MPPRQDNDNDGLSTSSQMSSEFGSLTHTSKLRRRAGRFDRVADTKSSIDEACVIIVDGQSLDVASWARRHPGGVDVLRKFHNKDATQAFHAVVHSERAKKLMKSFVVGKDKNKDVTTISPSQGKSPARFPIWTKKLFTDEDPYNVHKFFGLFCLLNYSYRFFLMLFGDPTAGFGSREQGQHSWEAVLCLIPHAVLSFSSLIFHTVPKERIVGKPMIWQEFRMHNIIFATRSVVCSAVAWLSLYHNHAPAWRKLALFITGTACLASNAAASWATQRLRQNEMESTTATMPYWESCSKSQQKIFKHFYALAQFGATIGCLMASNPAWPLAILLPIQGASFLMTLVRKGIITTRSYHAGYSVSLLLVFAVGVRQLFWMWSLDLLGLFVLALITYQLRRMGVDKYVIWIPIVLLRISFGDRYLRWQIW